MPEWPGKPVGSPKPVQKPQGESNILLKVCPICQGASSRYDVQCRYCARKARFIERIVKAHEISKRQKSGEEIPKNEQDFLEHNQKLLERPITPKDLEFLEKAPFPLPEQLIVARPSFENRLQFFMDRMQEAGRKVHSTKAATLFFTEFGGTKPISKREFVTFAIDHGVKPLMSADWENLFAAWDAKDVLKLFHEFTAEHAARSLTEAEPGKILSSLEASVALGTAGVKNFMDFAASAGIKPVKAFGDRPEQIAWRAEDVEVLQGPWRLRKELERLEETEQRLMRAIEMLNQPPVKWPAMQKLREKDKELIAIRALIAERKQALESDMERLQKLVAERETAEMEKKTSSDMRLARILALS